MTEDKKMKLQSFFYDMKKEQKELLKKKKYQITLKNTALHIMKAINNRTSYE